MTTKPDEISAQPNRTNGQPIRGGGLAALTQAFAQPKPAATYAPIGKTLHTLGITPRIEDVDGTECLVIPVAEIMDREWRYLTGGIIL